MFLHTGSPISDSKKRYDPTPKTWNQPIGGVTSWCCVCWVCLWPGGISWPIASQLAKDTSNFWQLKMNLWDEASHRLSWYPRVSHWGLLSRCSTWRPCMRSSYRSYQDRTFRFRALLMGIFHHFSIQLSNFFCIKHLAQLAVGLSTGLQELPLLEEESNSLFLMLRGMTTATWLGYITISTNIRNWVNEPMEIHRWFIWSRFVAWRLLLGIGIW